MESNPAAAFLQENTEASPRDVVSARTLYQRYANFCVENGYHKLGNSQFGREVFRAHPNAQKSQRRELEGRETVYVGIRLFNDTSETFGVPNAQRGRG